MKRMLLAIAIAVVPGLLSAETLLNLGPGSDVALTSDLSGYVGTNDFITATNDLASAADTSKCLKFVEASDGGYTALKIGTRVEPTASGLNGYGPKSLTFGKNLAATNEFDRAEGWNCHARGGYSYVRGLNSGTKGWLAEADGLYCFAIGIGSFAGGYRAMSAETGTELSNASNGHALAWVWQGGTNEVHDTGHYHSHGPGTFNINPVGGIEGFYIGEESLSNVVTRVSPPTDISKCIQFVADKNGNYTAVNLGIRGAGTIGQNSVAEGFFTVASGDCSHAEGAGAAANGDFSHAEGGNATASGNYSHVEGEGAKAQNEAEHAQGMFNVSHKASAASGNAGNTLSSIGFGTADSARKNAVETMQDGKTFIYGLGGYDGTNPTSSIDLASAINAKVDTPSLEHLWSDTEPYDDSAGNSTIFFRPRAFGIPNGGRIKAISLRTGSSPAVGKNVYLKIESNPAGTVYATSSTNNLNSTKQYYTFNFANAVSLDRDIQYLLRAWVPGTDTEPQSVRCSVSTNGISGDLHLSANGTHIRPELKVLWEEDSSVYFKPSAGIPATDIADKRSFASFTPAGDGGGSVNGFGLRLLPRAIGMRDGDSIRHIRLRTRQTDTLTAVPKVRMYLINSGLYVFGASDPFDWPSTKGAWVDVNFSEPATCPSADTPYNILFSTRLYSVGVTIPNRTDSFNALGLDITNVTGAEANGGLSCFRGDSFEFMSTWRPVCTVDYLTSIGCPLALKNFDLSTSAGLRSAVSDIIVALGGSVTSTTTLEEIMFAGVNDSIPSSGNCLALSKGYSYETNTVDNATVITTNEYPVVSLYANNTKVWTSDPADSSNYGWLVALIMALVGGAGAVLWKFFGRASSEP